jgi:hypothetical protein
LQHVAPNQPGDNSRNDGNHHSQHGINQLALQFPSDPVNDWRPAFGACPGVVAHEIPAFIAFDESHILTLVRDTPAAEFCPAFLDTNGAN